MDGFRVYQDLVAEKVSLNLKQGVELNCESHEIARNRAAFHRFNRCLCGDGASFGRESNFGTWHRSPEFFGSDR